MKLMMVSTSNQSLPSPSHFAEIPKSLEAAAVAAKHSKPPIRVRWNTKLAIARFPPRELARRKLADVAMDLLDLT